MAEPLEPPVLGTRAPGPGAHPNSEEVCPFSVSVVMVPAPNPVQGIAKPRVIGGKIVEPPLEMTLVPNQIHLNCYRGLCALWIPEREACAFKVSARAAAGLPPVTPKMVVEMA